MRKIICGENIVKSFGQAEENNKVLDGISVEVYEGEFVCVMGPSGSGKSTLMYALSGMDSIDSGRIFFGETELCSLREKELADLRRIKMGFVFQQPTLLKNLNLMDNIILPTVHGNRRSMELVINKARLLMKKTGIDELEKREINQVSGGQLQRAGICRALMSNPDIIFGDEPTGALNSKSAQEIMNLLSEINEEGTAIMLVTHDVSVAARTERILFMCDGALVDEIRLPKYRREDQVGDMEERIKIVTARMQEIGI